MDDIRSAREWPGKPTALLRPAQEHRRCRSAPYRRLWARRATATHGSWLVRRRPGFHVAGELQRSTLRRYGPGTKPQASAEW